MAGKSIGYEELSLLKFQTLQGTAMCSLCINHRGLSWGSTATILVSVTQGKREASNPQAMIPDGHQRAIKDQTGTVARPLD